ncbi:MAG TPA: mucoidy inhibitor MuiA family protein [Myxococcota bacterium]|nr:mucoidy inhibitor MuiA family protein [Myxococcota bacterium]
MHLHTALTYLLATLPAPAPIAGVTVFTDRAEVTRELTVTCQGGAAKAQFTGLSPTLDAKAMRADARGADVLGLRYDVEPTDEEIDERVKEVHASVRALEAQLAPIHEEAQALATRAQSTNSLEQVFVSLWREEMRNRTPPLDRWGGTLDRLAQERRGEARRTQALELRARKLQAQLDERQRYLASLVPRARQEQGVAAVSLRCTSESPRVTLSYVVQGATWAPEYDIRFTSPPGRKNGDGEAELVISAVVRQTTGEDWSGVMLALTTAKPSLGAAAPELAPIVVSGAKVQEERVVVEGSERRQRLREGGGAASDGTGDWVTVEDGGVAFRLQLKKPVNVVSDGRRQWFPAESFATKANSKLVAISKLAAHVYQVISLKSPAPFALPAGTLHAFRDGTYVGDSQLPYTAPGAPMEVSLGTDDELHLERVALIDMHKEAPLFGSKRTIERGFRTTVRNGGTRAESVEIREHFPVSKRSEIEVRLDDKRSTAGANIDGQRGFVTWKLDVPRGKTSQVDFYFNVAVPEDWKLGR